MYYLNKLFLFIILLIKLFQKMFLNYLFIIIFNVITSLKNEKLVFAELHFRHGARAPNVLDANGTGIDILGIKWPSPGELTPIGKRMEYLLGLRNRQRYIIEENLISEVFDPHEIRVFSSDQNRTLQSAVSHIQGFYPVFLHNGEKLEPEQCDKAVPPLNISNVTEIEEQKDFLNDSALPYYMNIIPIHVVHYRNSTYNCSLKLRDIFMNNLNTSTSLKNIVEEFNNKYFEQLKDIFPLKVFNNTLNFSFIIGFCDAYIADYAEGKDLSNFLEISKMSEADIYDLCDRANTINFRDIYYQDVKNESILFHNSLVMRDMINYMKGRVDDDIQLDISKKNLSDFSKPKLVILTGHDTTLSGQEAYFIRFFGLDIDSYYYPYFGSQITYEITREDVDDDMRGKLTYSDYTVKYYFNDDLLLNVSFDEFVKKVEKNIWSLEDIDKFCYGENYTSNTIIKNETNSDNKNNNSIDTNLFIIMIMGIIIFILVIVIVFLTVKLMHKNKDTKDDQLIKDERIINEDD